MSLDRSLPPPPGSWFTVPCCLSSFWSPYVLVSPVSLVYGDKLSMPCSSPWALLSCFPSSQPPASRTACSLHPYSAPFPGLMVSQAQHLLWPSLYPIPGVPGVRSVSSDRPSSLVSHGAHLLWLSFFLVPRTQGVLSVAPLPVFPLSHSPGSQCLELSASSSLPSAPFPVFMVFH